MTVQSPVVQLVGFLDDAVLRQFFVGWTEVVGVVGRIKSGSVGGALIQYPKIPSTVSEALAARILVRHDVYPSALRLERGGGADIRITTADGAAKVEVKGSGQAEFQTFGPKDYDCDLLVWLRFGEAAQIGLQGVVRATLFPTPRRSLGDLGSKVTHTSAEAAIRRGFDVRRLIVPLDQLLS
jgi:hypothetical protein